MDIFPDVLGVNILGEPFRLHDYYGPHFTVTGSQYEYALWFEDGPEMDPRFVITSLMKLSRDTGIHSHVLYVNTDLLYRIGQRFSLYRTGDQLTVIVFSTVAQKMEYDLSA